eukprot:SAG11_NODE_864_length_6839_cov_4.807567_6_plen_257_part_00
MLKLKELYYDSNENTSSANRLYEAVKRNKIDVTMKQVQAFIKNQAAYQKTKTFKKQQRLFSSITAPRPGSNLQIDFMYLRGPYKLKGLGQVLNIVDIHSRRAWSIPLKDRSAELHVPVLRKLRKLIMHTNEHGANKIRTDLEAIGVKPKDMPNPLLRTVKSINSDKEFTSKAFKDLLQEFGINHYESEVQDFAKNAKLALTQAHELVEITNGPYIGETHAEIFGNDSGGGDDAPGGGMPDGGSGAHYFSSRPHIYD